MMAAMSDTPDEGVSGDHVWVLLPRSPPSSISQIPMENPDWILFTDESAKRLEWMQTC